MSDKGSLVSSDGTITFEVNFVRRAGDVVEHIGNFSTDEKLVSGNEVRLVVDGKLRKQAALLHSAGHAIDACMDRCGLLTKLKATKGYHFFDGPYVEYQVCVSNARFGVFLRTHKGQRVAWRKNRVELVAVHQMHNQMTAWLQPTHRVLEKQCFVLEIVEREVQTSNVSKYSASDGVFVKRVCHFKQVSRVVLFRLVNH